MHHHYRPNAVALALVVLLTACGGSDDDDVASIDNPQPAAAKACDVASFASLALVGAKVTAATAVPAGSYTPTGAQALTNLPAFCRVQGSATPTSDSLVNFEMWVPQGSAWNGKLVVTGNGGYSPALSYGDMAYAMRQGYATMGGDTGHQTADGNDMFWGVGHPEKITDWGTRSINAITVPGKKVLAELQGKAATRAYYYGCSTGGHQGYAEVQRYPQDFDGVIAGDPGNNRVALNAEFLWRYLSNRETRTNNLILTPAKARLLTTAAVAACDALDGVTDQVIGDPRACTQHGGTGGTSSIAYAPSRGVYPTGTVAHHTDTFRALFLDLEDWVVRDVAPPDSLVPRVADGTLVRPEAVAFPAMKGLTWPVGGTPTAVPDFNYLGWFNPYSVLEYGPQFIPQDESGIATLLPPLVGPDYAILVPQVDASTGLTRAGIRSVEVQAPLGTSIEFNYVSTPGQVDLLSLTGAFMPFHKTEAARVAAGDGRPSLESLYGTQAGYVSAVTAAANRLVAQRLLLQRDADLRIRLAAASAVLP